MTVFGPVSEAAHGGHGGPAFNLVLGFGVLVLTWFGYWKKEERQKTNIWILVGISAMCAIPIWAGIQQLLR